MLSMQKTENINLIAVCLMFIMHTMDMQNLAEINFYHEFSSF